MTLPPSGDDRATRAKIVPRKQATGPGPCRPIWDEDFFLVFTLENKGKIILCLSNIDRALPLLSRYSGAALGCKFDQSRMSITRRQNIYLKTTCISIEKHVKAAC